MSSLSIVRTNTIVSTKAMTSAVKPPKFPVAIAAVAQLRSTSNKFQNLLDIACCARMAKHEGASMMFLPECFGFMGESSDQTLSEAEDPLCLDHLGQDNHNEATVTDALKAVLLDGNNNDVSSVHSGPPPPVRSLLDGLRTIAIESGLWISGGGIHVAGAPPDPETNNPRVYNTHIVMDDAGVIQCSYRKIHLFDVSIPGKVQLRESKTTAPGTELVVCDSPIGKLGISTCYDVRFPEMYVPLVQQGAQILLVPSAFTVPTGAAHWHTLLQGEFF
jgi:predicted amidohydrolase